MQIKFIHQLMNRKELSFYFLIGLFATAVDWATFTVSVVWLDLGYQYALVLALFMGGLTHYAANKKVTFQCTSRQYAAQIVVYVVLAMITVVSSMGLMSLLINYFYANKVWARILTTALMLLPNYLLHKHLTFNKKVFPSGSYS